MDPVRQLFDELGEGEWDRFDKDALSRLECRVLGASASNFLSSGDHQVVAHIEQDPVLWELLLDWEEEYCAEPGALDSGTHLMFAVERQ